VKLKILLQGNINTSVNTYTLKCSNFNNPYTRVYSLYSFKKINNNNNKTKET